MDIAFFRKISIMAKFFIPPMVAVFLILVIGASLTSAYNQIHGEVDDSEVISNAYSKTQDSLLLISTAHAQMIRTVSWTQAGVVKRILASSESDTRNSLAKAKESLDAIKKANDPYTSKNIDNVIAKFNEYSGDIDVILKNLKADVFFASMQMTNADYEYKDIVAEAAKISEILNAANTESDMHVARAMDNAKLIFIICTISTLIILSLLATIVGKAVSNPTNALTKVMEEMSQGNKNLEVPGTDRGDELGRMAQAVKIFRDSLIHAEDNDLKAAQERAEKEKKAKEMVDASSRFSDEVGVLLRNVGLAIDIVQQVSDNLDKTVNVATAKTTSVSSTTELASSNVTAVASAAEEMDRSIQEISGQVTKQSSVTSTANVNMDLAVNKVNGLNSSVELISDIVTLITSIADQTNLLALNATIEAARAGDAGKGFAVVASEVKGLATQTSKATEDIADKIAEIKKQTQETVEAINLVGGSLNELKQLATSVASAIGQQSAATGDISSNIAQAANGTSEVSRNIQDVSSAMRDISEYSKKVLHARQDLTKQSDSLKDRIHSFLDEVS